MDGKNTHHFPSGLFFSKWMLFRLISSSSLPVIFLIPIIKISWDLRVLGPDSAFKICFFVSTSMSVNAFFLQIFGVVETPWNISSVFFLEVIACQRADIGTRWSARDWEDTGDGADWGERRPESGGSLIWHDLTIFDDLGRFMSDSLKMCVFFLLLNLFGIIIAVKKAPNFKTKTFPTPIHGKKK